MNERIIRLFSLLPGATLIILIWRRYAVTIAEVAEKRDLGFGSYFLGALVIAISGFALWKNKKREHTFHFYVCYTAAHIIALTGGAFILANALMEFLFADGPI